MRTVNAQFAIELKKLIDEDIQRLTSEIIAGMLPEAEYRRRTGVIAGLTAALDKFEDAMTNVEKR